MSGTSLPAGILPWRWTITAKTYPSSCPSPTKILGIYATVNILVSLLSVVFGNRLVMSWLTCGFMGKKNSTSWKYMWIFPVALQLGANALIEAIIRRDESRISTFGVGELMLFLLARPRLSPIVLGFLGAWDNRRRRKVQSSLPETRTRSRTIMDGGSSAAKRKAGDEDHHWLASSKSQWIAEVILQALTFVVMGRTVHFAAQRGYYKLRRTTKERPPASYQLVYNGALYYAVATPCAWLIVLAVTAEYQDKVLDMKMSHKRALAALCLIHSWIASWIFWGGFVKLVGEFYCPPQMFTQAAIWTAFSVVGIASGTGA